jgi:TRAP-type C4-dicarboxylate transport system permease small subunit
MSRLLKSFYGSLMVLSAVAMVGTFVVVILGVVSRQLGFNVPGLDAYAGYCIAAVLFLALPETFRRGDHIRVTLVLQALPEAPRKAVEAACLVAGAGLCAFMAWYSVDLVLTSRALHDISPAADATPLWIPQLAMALGCVGQAVAFVEALVSRFSGVSFFEATAETARVE